MSIKKDKDIVKFINDLVFMKHRAGELGLYKTMHSLEEPQKIVGWEVADKGMTLFRTSAKKHLKKTKRLKMKQVSLGGANIGYKKV